MDELCQFLIQHMILDFDGDVTYDAVVGYLSEDDSKLAQKLRARLIEDKGVEDFLIVLSDCLREAMRSGVTPDRVQKQIGIYVDS